MVRRNWFEAYLLVLALGSGTQGLLGRGGSRTVEASFPAWGQYLWFGGLLAGSLLALAGVALASVVGTLLERAALFLLAGLSGGYTIGAVVLCVVDTGPSAYATTLVAGFGLLCLTRTRQIRSDLDARRQALRKLADSGSVP